MKSILKNLFLIFFMTLFLIETCFSSFEMKNLRITYIVNEEGVVNVKEEMDILIKTRESINDYRNAISRNDLSFWNSLTLINEIRYHVSAAYLEIKNLKVIPQTLSDCPIYSSECVGSIVYEYTVSPLLFNNSIMNDTGLFFMENYKPRTTRFTLNQKALSLDTTESGDLKINPKIEIIFILPQNSILFLAKPYPLEFEEKFTFENPPYINIQRLQWGEGIYPNFNIIFEIEDSIEKEIISYFSNLQQNLEKILRDLYNLEGLILIFLILIVIGAYFYLKILGKKKINNT